MQDENGAQEIDDLNPHGKEIYPGIWLRHKYCVYDYDLDELLTTCIYDSYADAVCSLDERLPDSHVTSFALIEVECGNANLTPPEEFWLRIAPEQLQRWRALLEVPPPVQWSSENQELLNEIREFFRAISRQMENDD